MTERTVLKVGVVGLGTMGAPMARHLIAAGHEVTVWNRTRSKEEPLAVLGATRGDSPAAVAEGADAVLTCVSDDPDLRAVVLGENGVGETLPSGSVLVDCSTASPSLARDLAWDLARTGRMFVDAPVSGGSEGAEKGTLTVFLGGSADAVAKALPVVQTFGARITHLGEAGSGQAAKAVNQVVLAGAYAGVAEGIVLAEKFGLPFEQLLPALSAGAADSWVLRQRAGNMVKGAYPLGFRTSLHLKDVRIALREAAAMDLPLEVAELVAGIEEKLVAAGFGDEDVSNLARHTRSEDA
ncbi:NAD(P)-dependent oxidoreductase [Kineosporia mesophila]|uniref:NAD(P)-dependent oxidoreductase n=1 Tax=Kineosporia mesophila TaxID=566012 RepID=A0ABP7A4E1_9ACTN|nr:NAD(P)-dependent oxidoreductase [Kineosporia mesophila]MCD5353828.1 NAD(P)-dependent oxidoreductase [Kineosporia mesophila]